MKIDKIILLILPLLLFKIAQCQSTNPQSLPCFNLSEEQLNNNLIDIYSANCLFLNQAEEIDTQVKHETSAIECISEQKIEVFKNTEIRPNSEYGVTLKINDSPLNVAWFEPESSLGEVGLYNKLELGIELPLSIQDKIDNFINSLPDAINPYDPDQINVYAITKYQLTDGSWTTEKTSYCFYYEEYIRDTSVPLVNWDWYQQPNDYQFRLRYAPTHLGVHFTNIYVSLPDEDLIDYGQVFYNVVPSDNKGFLEIGASNRYFEFSDGTGFFPVGGNLSTENTEHPQLNSTSIPPSGTNYAVSPYEQDDLMHPLFYDSYGEFLTSYKESGANFVRLINLPW